MQKADLLLLVRVHAVRHNLGYSIQPTSDGYEVRFGKESLPDRQYACVGIAPSDRPEYIANNIDAAVAHLLENIIRDIPPMRGLKTVGDEGPEGPES